jgi:hypothetical protein
MGREELIEAFRCGDMARVEFFELGLEAGMSLEEIGEIIKSEDDGDL